MSRAASRIGTVDYDAQAAAREAARREGKSLGQWLHGAIADRAADLGVPEGELPGSERLEAITARLDRLGGRGAQSASPAPRRQSQAGRGDGPRSRGHDGRDSLNRDAASRDAPFDDRRSFRRAHGASGDGRVDDGPRGGRESASHGWSGDSADDRNDERDDALLAEAVASMERRSARSEQRTDEALLSFAKLMETSEARRSQERDAVHALARQMASLESSLSERIATSDSPIKGALARLEARLDAIGKRSAAESAVREQARPAAPAAPVEDEPLRRLEGKINSLLQAVHGGQAAAAQAAAPVEASPLAIRAAQAAQAAEPPRRRLGDAIAEISRRQQSLEGEPGRFDRSRIEPLLDRRQSQDRREDRRDDRREDGGELRHPRGECSAAGATTAASLVETQAAAPRAALRQPPVDEARAERQRAEQAQLREEISAITARMGALPAATREQAAADRAKQLAAQQASLEAARIEAVRAETERMTARLEAERIAARAEAERAAAQAASRLDAERAARLEAESLARRDGERLARYEAERASGPDPVTAANFQKIEQRLDAIAGRVCEVLDRPTVEPQLGTLELMVRDLAARLDAVGARHAEGPSVEGQALDQLQQQVEALVGRFERSETDLALLPTLAGSVRQLFDQLDSVRAGVELAAAETARETAREVLRIAADDRRRQPAAEPAEAAAAAGPASGEAEAMVAMQSMLAGVHDVLDKLVGRLTAVESNLAEVRARPLQVQTPAPPQPAAQPSIPAPQPPVAQAPAAAAPTASIPPAAPAGPMFRPATQRPAAPRMAEPELGRDAVREPILPPAGRRIEAPAAARFAVEADEDAQRLNFIAAARRAAKSAQMEAAQMESGQASAPQPAAEAAASRRPFAEGRPTSEAEVRAGLLSKSREYVAAHKRPVLMGLAAILVVVGTLALLQRTGLGGSDNVALAPQPIQTAQLAAPAAPSGPEMARVAADELTPSALPRTAATDQAGQAQPNPPTQAAAVPVPPAPSAPAARTASATNAATDPMPTGSLTSLPSFAAQAPTAVVRPPAVPAPQAAGLPAGLQAAAEGGNAAAQYDFGARTADGRGVTRDPKLAAVWLSKAADQGLAPAQYRLAMMYEKGVGVATDKPRARALYTAAAEAGNPRAMHNLAVMLADGDGHPDYAAAAGWFRKAAGYGIHDSQYNLAILLARGLGTAQSLVQSYQWFDVAASANDADAAHKRDEVGSKLNANDLALAKSLAAAYQPKSADPAALEASFPAGDGAPAATRLNSVKSKVSSL